VVSGGGKTSVLATWELRSSRTAARYGAFLEGTSEPPRSMSSCAMASVCSSPNATTSRGVEALGSVWTFLDLTSLGRQEVWEDTPPGRPQTPPYGWWRLHDEYESSPSGAT
jgi:Bacterial protein of unknown function (DUF899)